MRQLQNTLYITRQGCYLHKERETLVVECERKKLIQLPIHAIANIFCFGNVLVSPYLLGFCGENQVNLAFYSEYGKFLGRLQGRQSGNVLLRRAQYRISAEAPLDIARNIIAAKIQSARRVLQRRQRNHGTHEDVTIAIRQLNASLKKLQSADHIDRVRGIEGDAAAQYFAVFRYLLTDKTRQQFDFNGRNRRPPRDPINAMLSLLYSVVGKEISGALQGVGLDPQVGFLHTDRPGRDSLAQDILEEFRAWWIDRMVISMLNRGQFTNKDFIYTASGAVELKDDSRKALFQALQMRKQEKIQHPYLEEEVEIGLLPHIQAQLLARHLRGDIACYPPFLMR